MKLQVPVKPSVRVCSKHLRAEDLVVGKDGRRYVKATAIPIPLQGVDEADLSFSKPEGRMNHCKICGNKSNEKGISYHRQVDYLMHNRLIA